MADWRRVFKRMGDNTTLAGAGGLHKNTTIMYKYAHGLCQGDRRETVYQFLALPTVTSYSELWTSPFSRSWRLQPPGSMCLFPRRTARCAAAERCWTSASSMTRAVWALSRPHGPKLITPSWNMH